MSSATCEQCGEYITATNTRWPGFCSPLCRDVERNRRQAARDKRRHRDRLALRRDDAA
jgi:endogenous inhibitor of DNA gyrase (YacG/DUF329 family)